MCYIPRMAINEQALDKAVKVFGIAMTRENSERNALAAVRERWEREQYEAMRNVEVRGRISTIIKSWHGDLGPQEAAKEIIAYLTSPQLKVQGGPDAQD